MQSVADAFSVEEVDSVRKIASNLRVSWKKDNILANRTFTIGVSTIGGNDVIGINPGAIGSPGNYRYFDESGYLLSLAYENALNMPTGGLVKGLADAILDNTSGRFTPRYMGGNSELFTAVLPRRPFILNAGFNYAGIDNLLPQFSGITTKTPEVNVRSKVVHLAGSDYVDFFQNRYLDRSIIFTSQRTDVVIQDILSRQGLSSAQYDLDQGINIIPFAMFEQGTRLSDLINDLVEAENGHFYQDESGIFKFENRQHWNNFPYFNVQRIITTAQVIDARTPTDDHIINVVEVKSKLWTKQPLQVLFRLALYNSISVPANSSVEYFISFDNPALSITRPADGGVDSYFKANTDNDGTGTDLTSSISITKEAVFAQAVKYTFTNSSTTTNLFVTELVVSGRAAKVVSDIYYRAKDGSSVTAFEERPLLIENSYIQNQSWAESYGQMILSDFSAPENLQKITIRAIPELQLGDLVSWQGRYWRLFGKKTTLDPGVGFVQELTLLQRTVQNYFRIGVSTIGGADKIAP